MEIECQVYWGKDNPIKCRSKNTARVKVGLVTGKKRIICMCEKCQRKYFGEVRRPTKRAPDVKPRRAVKAKTRKASRG